MNSQIKIVANVLATIEKLDGEFIARCPVLNVVTRGRTRRKARQNLKEEIQFLFETCAADGTLEAVIERRLQIFRESLSQTNPADTSWVPLPSSIPSHLLARLTDAALAAS